MRTIHKAKEPASLTKYRGAPNATWNGYAEKADAWEQLCAEQGFLCAFCCSRVEPESANLNVKIGVAPDKNRGVRCAHWMPQSVDAAKQLVWTNLLGSCFGGEGTSEEHCDVAQRDHELRIHPVFGNPAPETVFTYGSDGSITGKTDGAKADITTLNLDKSMRLRRARKGAWAAVYKLLADRAGARTVSELTKMRDSVLVPSAGRLAPFVNVTIFVLERQIRRHGGTA